MRNTKAATEARRSIQTCALGHPLVRVGTQRRCHVCRASYLKRRKNGQRALMKLERSERLRREALAELERLGIKILS